MKKILFVCSLIVSCAGQESDFKKQERVSGHLVYSAGGTCLITGDFRKTYQIGANDVPESVWEFLKFQKRLSDPNSLNGVSVFASIDVEGEDYAFQKSGIGFKVKRVLRIDKVNPDFYKRYINMIESGRW